MKPTYKPISPHVWVWVCQGYIFCNPHPHLLNPYLLTHTGYETHENQTCKKSITDHLGWEPIHPTKEMDSVDIITQCMLFICEEIQDFRFMPRGITCNCLLFSLARLLAPVMCSCLLQKFKCYKSRLHGIPKLSHQLTQLCCKPFKML